MKNNICFRREGKIGFFFQNWEGKNNYFFLLKGSDFFSKVKNITCCLFLLINVKMALFIIVK